MSASSISAPEARRRRRLNAKHLFVLACVAVLLLSGTFVWRYFGFGDVAAFTEQAVVFDGTELRLPQSLAEPTGRLRVVHFWDPACEPCNRETGAHLSYLISMYRGAAIDFYSVRKPGTSGELPAFLRGKMSALAHIDGQERIPASPAVAIWDADGKLVYVGPYSLGMACTSANSFVEPMLDRLLAGKAVSPPTGFLAVGCYCPWH